MNESLILADESLILVNKSLILADESLNSVNESLILADESLNSVNESLILVDESLNSTPLPPCFFPSPQSSAYAPCPNNVFISFQITATILLSTRTSLRELDSSISHVVETTIYCRDRFRFSSVKESMPFLHPLTFL
ncbi:hypothetical protein [Nostoc sp.]|uniref:hypothetical protein n=1 Tax=Nostoc sp. TaxID=1180 RepID=UPI003FA5EF0D